jgi:ammonia channel protein AmtB
MPATESNMQSLLDALNSRQARSSAAPMQVPTSAPAAQSKKTAATANLAAYAGAMLVGGIAGYVLWKKHPVVGVFSGMAVGGAGVTAATGKPVHGAAHLGSAAAAAYCSLKWQKHPALGYILGSLAASVALNVAAGTVEKG